MQHQRDLEEQRALRGIRRTVSWDTSSLPTSMDPLHVVRPELGPQTAGFDTLDELTFPL